MKETYIYCGNRSTVLKKMISLNLKIDLILPIKGSWLERECKKINIPFISIYSKLQLINILYQTNFDIFVSAGCKYILPISDLKIKKQHSKFINIHPSYLPDLRGADPIPASLLFRRDSGVTCHHMNDGIDTGDKIYAMKIKYFQGLDCKLLYQLCFNLEPYIFEQALEKKFLSFNNVEQINNENSIYYTFTEGDNFFDENDTVEVILNKVKAFNTSSKGFHFRVENKNFTAYNAQIISSTIGDYLFEKDFKSTWTSIFTYEDNMIINKKDAFIKLSQISTNTFNALGPISKPIF